MSALRQAPVPMPTSELADLLAQMAEAVRSGDSLEGSIEYTLPEPEESGDPWAKMVMASVRTGNLQGQGGMIMLGKLTDETQVVRAQLDRALEQALPFGSRRIQILIRALMTELSEVQQPGEKPTLTKRLANAHVSQADAEQAAEDATARQRPGYDPDFADRLENGGYDHG